MQKLKIAKTFTAGWSNSIGGDVVRTERTFTEGETYLIGSRRPEGWMVYGRVGDDIDPAAARTFFLFNRYINEFCEFIS